MMHLNVSFVVAWHRVWMFMAFCCFLIAGQKAQGDAVWRRGMAFGAAACALAYWF
jgi:hypothetical protein